MIMYIAYRLIKTLLNCFFLSFLQGWYIVTYALGIYHLNLFIAFLSPKIDPAMADFEGISDNRITIM